MKNFIIADGGALMFDTDTQNVTTVDSKRESIRRIWVADEDAHLKANFGEYTKEADIKAGDIVIAFWDQDFPNKVVVINNDEWLENLKTYDAIMQARKEEWAKNKSNVNELDTMPA